MATIYPDIENIKRLKVQPTQGEWNLVKFLEGSLDNTYEVFFNPFLDGDRPDIIILKEGCAAFIIEIKDWHLKNYSISEDNKWYVDSTKSIKSPHAQPIKSPHAQVFKYKKNLYDRHLHVLGLSMLENKNFFNLVHCYVYFFGSTKNDIENTYRNSLGKINQEQQLIREQFKNDPSNHERYEKQNNFWLNKKRAIERDKSISFGGDNNSANNLIRKIKQRSSRHILFDDRIYDDFKRRLSPPEHTLKQGILIKLDKKQLSLAESNPVKEKIKGVAGCGKTSILAQRVINAYSRHNQTVLILTFNITLKNFICDKISDLLGERDFEISNYHQFFTSQLNNSNIEIDSSLQKMNFEDIYDQDLFSGKTCIKYNTILIDEIQDFKSEWVKIIRDNFLVSDGEMVLFGDEAQNIYKRMVLFGDEAQNIYKRTEKRASVIAQGFGSWKKLTRSYRTNIASPLNQLFKDFQKKFLLDKYNDIDLLETHTVQTSLGFNILKYENISEVSWHKTVFDSIQKYIKIFNLHPNDIVVLGSSISSLILLSDLYVGIEKTHCMFETIAELASWTKIDIKELRNDVSQEKLNKIIKENIQIVIEKRKVKKNHFRSNSGLIKFSTVHSFKGLEEKTVFCILLPDDTPELIYTSITRSTENLVILDIEGNNICSDFFRANIN